MIYGVTDKGFRRKTYQECLDDRIARARERYGVNIDTSETSVLGTLIRNTAYDEAELWELAEHIYLSAFVRSSEGTSLDNVGDYLTMSRNPATKSKGLGIFKGDNGLVIPKGFKIKSESGNVFETVERGILSEGMATIPIQSVGAGKEYNALKDTLTLQVNPLMGLESVTNMECIGGRDVETDSEFRARYYRSFALGGGSTVDAIRAGLLNIDNVIDAEVLENDTMEELIGIPPKSVHCIVVGGEPEEVAETILTNKAGGIQAFGKEYLDIKDSMGRTHKIGFTRADYVDVYVRVSIKPTEGYKGDEATVRAIINYIGGVDSDGIEYKGLGLGQDVINARVSASVMCLGGVEDIEIEISKDGKEYVKTNLEIGEFEVATTDASKVVISYV